MEPHRIGAVTRDGMRSGVNRIDFHLTSKAEWFHSAKTEWSDTGLPRRRVTEPPYPMQIAIRCVMNPVSCNLGLNLKFCLADFVYLIQELRSDCVHLSNKYAKIALPSARFLNQTNKIRETEL